MKNKVVVKKDGIEIEYSYPVDVEYTQKALALPYQKLRKLVAIGGVKFPKTPNRDSLEIILDEIDDLKGAYEKVVDKKQ